MENLEQFDPAVTETLKLQTSLLTAQIQQLDNSRMTKRKRREKDYLQRQLKNIEAFTQLKPRQRAYRQGKVVNL